MSLIKLKVVGCNGCSLRTTLQWHPHTRITYLSMLDSGFSVWRRRRVTPFIWCFHYWHQKQYDFFTQIIRPFIPFCSSVPLQPGQALGTKVAYVFTSYLCVLTRVYTCGISVFNDMCQHMSTILPPSHSSHALNPSFYDKAHASSKDHGLDVDFDMLQFCALKARTTSLWVCEFSHGKDRLEDSCWGFAHVLFMIGWMERCYEAKVDLLT